MDKIDPAVIEKLKSIEIPITSRDSYVGEAYRRGIYPDAFGLLGDACRCETYPQVLEFYERLQGLGHELSHFAPFLKRHSAEVTLNYILDRVKYEAEEGFDPHQVYRDDAISLANLLPLSMGMDWQVKTRINNSAVLAKWMRSDGVDDDNPYMSYDRCNL